MKDRILSTVLILFGITFLGVGAFFLWQKLSDYEQGDDVYAALTQNTDDSSISGSTTEQMEVTDKDGEKIQLPQKTVNWDELKAYAKNVRGWVYFEEPDKIDYPIMQGNDNGYYLHRLYDGKKNSCGSIFMNFDNNGNLSDRNTIIYGHNMRNRSMFGSLRNFKEKNYWKENSKFYIYTPDGKIHVYKIFAVINAKDGTNDYMYSFATDESFIEYVNRMKGKAMFPTDVTVEASDRIVSLSTCASIGSKKGKRLMVQGIEVYTGDVQEPAAWYEANGTVLTDTETE